jgi:hypothetical protein
MLPSFNIKTYSPPYPKAQQPDYPNFFPLRIANIPIFITLPASLPNDSPYLGNLRPVKVSLFSAINLVAPTKASPLQLSPFLTLCLSSCVNVKEIAAEYHRLDIGIK